VHNAVNEEWVKSSKWPEQAKMLMYWQKKTKYLINLELNEFGHVQHVNFSRWGNETITEIPYGLAEQSLASLRYELKETDSKIKGGKRGER
jgi:hypothetical protein